VPKRIFLAGLLIASGALAWQSKPVWPPPIQKLPESTAALPVDQALKTFFLPPGYKLEVIASEPLI